MTRRHSRIDRPRPFVSTGESATIWIALLLIVFTTIVIGMAFAAFISPAHAHDSWINRGSYKNSAGEWCCGDYDCKSYTKTSSTAQGWLIDGELVPYDEAMPVAPPDGQLTV